MKQSSEPVNINSVEDTHGAVAVSSYQTTMDLAEAYYRKNDYDACIRACCRALDQLPGEEEPTHLISACQAAMRSESGISVQPVPLFFANWDLFKKQQNSNIFPGSVCPAAGNFLYALVRLLAPQLVIETGTLFGFSCICIGQALKDNGSGRLLAFDLFQDKNYPDLADGQTGFEQVSRFVADAGLREIVSLTQGNSSDKIRSAFAGGSGPQIDLAFIDGDHFMKGCVEDFLAVDENLVDGGIIVLHDTEPRESGWMGPRYLLEKLKGHDALQGYEVLNLPTVDKLGMCLLRKQNDVAVKSWRPSIHELIAETVLFNKHFRRRKSHPE